MKNNYPVIKLDKIEGRELSAKGNWHYNKKFTRPYKKISYQRNENGSKPKTPPSFYTRLLNQTMICLAVCFAALIMSKINFKPVNDAADGLRTLLEYETNIDRGLDFLKLTEGETTVFSDAEKFLQYPVDGEIIGVIEDEQGNSAGLVFRKGSGVVSASAKGRVFYIDDISSSNPYIRIRHDNGFDTLYAGVAAEVKTGDDIEAGQRIGSCVSQNMGFMLLKNGEAVNPYDYFAVNTEDKD